MMNLTRRIYDVLPTGLQSLAISAAGVRGRARKFGREFRSAMTELECRESQAPGDVAAFAECQLKAVLAFARENIPFYRDLDLPPEDLLAWPVMDKSVVREQRNRLLPESRIARAALILKTSGTTGSPLEIPCDKRGYQREMAFRWRHKAWAGIALDAPGAFFAGHHVVSADQTEPPFWRMDRAENRLLFSSYHIGPRTLGAYVRALEDFRPTYLHGYPSSLALVAAEALRLHADLHIGAVFCASESLHPFQRGLIERAFRAKVYNWYGQTELTCNVVECASGRMHVRSDYGHVEIGEAGELIATGFNNRAMPFIRYRTGDHVGCWAPPCECGLPFPVVDQVMGRAEDYVVTPEGFLVGRLDHILKGVHGVCEAQLVQIAPSLLRILVVPAPGWNPSSAAQIEAQARERLGLRMKIAVETVQQLERSPSGKIPFVISTPARERRGEAEYLSEVQAPQLPDGARINGVSKA